MSYYVYIHEFPNGKRYIGATTLSLERRWAKGLNYKYAVREAIDYFGWDNIKHYFYTIPEDKRLMYSLEKYLIEYFDTTNPDKGYNRETGGDKEFSFSDDTLKKLSELKTGELNNMYGRRQSDDTKRKISEANSKSVIVSGVLYGSKTAASKELGCSITHINTLIKRGDAQYA